MKRYALTGLLVVLAALSCSRQAPSTSYTISYRVGIQPAEHYLNVEMTYVPSGKKPADVTFRMPVWAPGYYRIMDFPKYLSDFSATDGKGQPVRWEKTGKNGWKVDAADTLRIRYRVYANARSVAESRVQEDMAFIAPNGVFMHVQGDVKHPVDVSFDMPASWSRISTALDGKDGTYTAPDFDVLYDSPLLLGNHYSNTFEHEGHLYEFALETPQGFEESPIAQDFLKGVSASTALFGSTAYDHYHLLLLGPGGGGLEHQASQACYTAGHWDFDTRESYLSMLRFLTHEYFHNYNVKAIRPIELGPFDYDREVFTPMLWISEGFTVYYESKVLVDAGVETEQEHLDFLSSYIRDTQNTEGRRHMSMRQSSYDIWLNFFPAASNSGETTISYYVKGPVIGLLFDATIQRMTGGQRSLDDLMRLLYNRYYREQGRGFTEEEFWACAEEIAGGPVPELRRYVDTTDEIDYESILTPFGLTLDRTTWTLSKATQAP